MASRSFSKLLLGTPLLAVPLFVVPALCFTLNRTAFVWSLVVIGSTGWRLYRATRITELTTFPAKHDAVPRLALATLLVQMLAFLWIGAVWLLQGAAQLVMFSRLASQIVGWIQAHWFAGIAAWSVLFVVVCALFRLARPLLAWHRRALHCASSALSQPDAMPVDCDTAPGLQQ